MTSSSLDRILGSWSFDLWRKLKEWNAPKVVAMNMFERNHSNWPMFWKQIRSWLGHVFCVLWRWNILDLRLHIRKFCNPSVGSIDVLRDHFTGYSTLLQRWQAKLVSGLWLRWWNPNRLATSATRDGLEWDLRNEINTKNMFYIIGGGNEQFHRTNSGGLHSPTPPPRSENSMLKSCPKTALPSGSVRTSSFAVVVSRISSFLDCSIEAETFSSTQYLVLDAL